MVSEVSVESVQLVAQSWPRAQPARVAESRLGGVCKIFHFKILNPSGRPGRLSG